MAWLVGLKVAARPRHLRRTEFTAKETAKIEAILAWAESLTPARLEAWQ